MPIDLDRAGATSGPYELTWDERDVVLYALAVGAGVDDPALPHALTAENITDKPLAVLPTFPLTRVLEAGGLRRSFGTFDETKLVHAEQVIELHAPIPAATTLLAESRISGIFDKGSGALVELTTTASEKAGGPVFTSRSSLFIRGEGGWGGPRGGGGGWQQPEREPDAVERIDLREDQALLYRLTGDLNPIHSDPAAAERGRFPRPILHGLCTYGFSARAVIGAVLGGDPAALAGMSGRFTSPVFPGDRLTVSMWEAEDGTILFRTATDRGISIDRGMVETGKST